MQYENAPLKDAITLLSGVGRFATKPWGEVTFEELTQLLAPMPASDEHDIETTDPRELQLRGIHRKLQQLSTELDAMLLHYAHGLITLDDLKKWKGSHLPYMMPAGAFCHRCKDGLLSRSGICTIDIDNCLSVPDTEACIRQHLTLPWRMIHRSATRGLHVYIDCSGLTLPYEDIYRAFSAEIERLFAQQAIVDTEGKPLRCDPACKDFSRGYFMNTNTIIIR